MGGVDAGGEAEPVIHAMSIDVEDWYHCLDPEPGNWSDYESRVRSATRAVLDVFARTDTRATFFVLGDVAEREPELVEEIHAAGHEVASHGSEHRFVYRQSPAAFEADVRRSVERLREITGDAVLGYRAPYFSITRRSSWALPVLRSLGLRYDSSVHPVHNHRYGNARAPRLPHSVVPGLLELPISTYPVGPVNVPFAGGIYFRALPWAVVERFCHRLEDRGERIVFYLHPWELDPGQPRISLPRALSMRHYHALDATAAKLERLCRALRFGPMRDAVGV